MTAKKDLKKQFELILGRPIDLDSDDPVVLRESVALSTYFPDEDIQSEITSREIGTTGDSTKRCRGNSAVNVSGGASTGSNGIVEFLLSDFICNEDEFSFTAPINVVATPRGRIPVFLTLTHSFITDGQNVARDIKIKVFSWNANGNPAPNIGFDWQCVTPYTQSVD
jgi:hypothetical protein